MASPTLQQSIAAYEATYTANDARMNELVELTAKEGRTFEEDEKTEYEELKVKNASILSHLTVLKETAERSKKTAQPIPPEPAPGMEIKPKHGEFVVRANPNLPKGIGFTRVAMALAAAKGNSYAAAEIAKGAYGWKDSTPQVETVLRNWEMVTRGAVSPGDTTTTAFASPLVQYTNLASEFVEYLRPMTILGKMNALRRVPFNIRFATQTGAVSMGWVGQGNAIPATSQTYTTTTLGFAKIAAIVAITNELATFSSPSAEELVRNDLAASTASFMDQQFIDPGVAAVSNVSPASVTNGATASQATGTWNTTNLASVVDVDMATLFNNLTSNNVPLDNLVWVMTPDSAYKISKIRTSNGPTAFPDIRIDGGTLEGIPVIVSQQVPHSTSAGSILVLMRQSDIFYADEGGVQIDASQEAGVQMNTAPSNSAASLLSAFQSDLLLLRLRRIVNWQRRHDVSVTYLDNVHFS